MRKRVLSLALIFLALCCLLFAIKSVYYEINQALCRDCGRCTIHCTPQAIQYNEQIGGLVINQDLCNGCGACYQDCIYGAINPFTGNQDNTIPYPVLQLRNSPNPMQDFVDFKISLPRDKQLAELIIANNKGQIVYKSKFDKSNSFRWNGMDKHGNKLPGGVYIARLICGKEITSNKITLVR